MLSFPPATYLGNHDGERVEVGALTLSALFSTDGANWHPATCLNLVFFRGRGVWISVTIGFHDSTGSCISPPEHGQGVARMTLASSGERTQHPGVLPASALRHVPPVGALAGRTGSKCFGRATPLPPGGPLSGRPRGREPFPPREKFGPHRAALAASMGATRRAPLPARWIPQTVST